MCTAKFKTREIAKKSSKRTQNDFFSASTVQTFSLVISRSRCSRGSKGREQKLKESHSQSFTSQLKIVQSAIKLIVTAELILIMQNSRSEQNSRAVRINTRDLLWQTEFKVTALLQGSFLWPLLFFGPSLAKIRTQKNFMACKCVGAMCVAESFFKCFLNA